MHIFFYEPILSNILLVGMDCIILCPRCYGFTDALRFLLQCHMNIDICLIVFILIAIAIINEYDACPECIFFRIVKLMVAKMY